MLRLLSSYFQCYYLLPLDLRGNPPLLFAPITIGQLFSEDKNEDRIWMVPTKGGDTIRPVHHRAFHFNLTAQ